MGETAGLSTMQLICSVGMHIALLLPLLAMPVTRAESGDWKFEDYVIYLMLKNPPPAARGAAAQEKSATQPGSGAMGKDAVVPAPAPVERRAAPPADQAFTGKGPAGKGMPADNPAAEAAVRPGQREDGEAGTLKEATMRSGNSQAPQGKQTESLPKDSPGGAGDAAGEEALVLLPDTPAANGFFDAGNATAPMAAAPSLPAVTAERDVPPAKDPALAERPRIAMPAPQKAAPADNIPVAEQKAIVPLPATPPVSGLFAAGRTTLTPAPAKPVTSRAADKGKAALKKTRVEERTAASAIQGVLLPGRGRSLDGLVRSAAASRLPEQGASSLKAAPSSLPVTDLTNTPGPSLSGQPIVSAMGKKPEKTTAPPPLLPLQTGGGSTGTPAPRTAPQEEGEGGRLPVLPLAAYAPLKIEIACAQNCLQDLSMRLVKKRYPDAGKRREPATEVDMKEETLRSAARDTRLISVAAAARGTYAFMIVNNSRASDVVDISFLFSDGPKLLRVKKYTAATIAAGGKATYRFIIPDAIFWDDEDRFGGTIEDSGSITKFNDETGLVWREEKSY